MGGEEKKLKEYGWCGGGDWKNPLDEGKFFLPHHLKEMKIFQVHIVSASDR